MECSNCTSSLISTVAGRRRVSDIDMLQPKSRENNGALFVDGITTLLDYCGQSLGGIIDWIIEHDPSFLFDRMKVFSNLGKSQRNSLLFHLRSNEKNMINSLDCVYFTDRYLVSDTLFFHFYDFFNFQDLLVTEKELR